VSSVTIAANNAVQAAQSALQAARDAAGTLADPTKLGAKIERQQEVMATTLRSVAGTRQQTRERRTESIGNISAKPRERRPENAEDKSQRRKRTSIGGSGQTKEAKEIKEASRRKRTSIGGTSSKFGDRLLSVGSVRQASVPNAQAPEGEKRERLPSVTRLKVTDLEMIKAAKRPAKATVTRPASARTTFLMQAIPELKSLSEELRTAAVAAFECTRCLAGFEVLQHGDVRRMPRTDARGRDTHHAYACARAPHRLRPPVVYLGPLVALPSLRSSSVCACLRPAASCTSPCTWCVQANSPLMRRSSARGLYRSPFTRRACAWASAR
jgi:hypothetical protein